MMLSDKTNLSAIMSIEGIKDCRSFCFLWVSFVWIYENKLFSYLYRSHLLKEFFGQFENISLF